MVRSFGCTLPGEVAAMNGPAPDTPSQSYPTNYRYLRGSWRRHPRRRGLRAFGFKSRSLVVLPGAGRTDRGNRPESAGPEPRTPQPRRDASRRRCAADCPRPLARAGWTVYQTAAHVLTIVHRSRPHVPPGCHFARHRRTQPNRTRGRASPFPSSPTRFNNRSQMSRPISTLSS